MFKSLALSRATSNNHYLSYIMGKTKKMKSKSASPKAASPRRRGKSSVGQSSPARKKPSSPQSSSVTADLRKTTKTRKSALPTTPTRQKTKQSSTTPNSSSTSSSKRTLSRIKDLTLASPEGKKSSKKHRPTKTVAVPSGRGKGDASSPSTKLPKFTDIDWVSKQGILQALSKYNQPDQYLGLELREQIILLASNFTPTDLRPLLMNLVAQAGEDFRNINWDNYTSTKKIAPKCARLIVTILNAKTKLAIPQKIVVK